MKEAVVIFGKTARPGEVKTRLCPPLQAEEAALLYDAFARDVFELVARYRDEEEASGNRRVKVVLAWDGEESDRLAVFATRELGFEFVGQDGGDLGARLRRIANWCRQKGAESMMILGTDSPTLSMEHLQTARLWLERCDVVFGPAFDGGYYLIGLGESRAELPLPEEVVFDGIEWSTREVMEQSWRIARRQGLLCELLGYWYDIDTFEDLKRARFHLFEYLASREPLVGQHTRSILRSQSLTGLGDEE